AGYRILPSMCRRHPRLEPIAAEPQALQIGFVSSWHALVGLKGLKAGFDQNQTHSVLEQQRRKVVQTAPPSEPLMGRLWRYEEVCFAPPFLTRFSFRFWVAPNPAAAAATTCTRFNLSASITYEHKFDFLLESRHVSDFVRADAATAKKTD